MLRGLEPSVTNDDVRPSAGRPPTCTCAPSCARCWLTRGVLLLGLQLLAYFANTLGYNLVPVRRTYRRGLIHC